MSDDSRAPARWRSLVTAGLHRLRVTFLRRTDPRSQRIRARTLAVLFALVFALLGVARELSLVSFVIQPPFDLDWVLRTVSLGWYDPDDTLPVPWSISTKRRITAGSRPPSPRAGSSRD